MKTITMKTLATGIIASVLLLASCAGPAGATGPQGVAGTNGSTNVASYMGSTQNSSWVVNTNNYELDATFPVSAITQDVVTNGTIQVFLGNSAGSQWSAMPFSLTGVEFNYTYSVGQVVIQETQGNSTLPTNPGVQYFKFVVIPSAARKAHPEVNLHNYNEIKKAFNVIEHF
jgi:hypothetical protein